MIDELNSNSTNELIGELYYQIEALYIDSSEHSIYSKPNFNAIKEIIKLLEKRPEFSLKDQN